MKPTPTRIVPRQDNGKATRFVEELGWLLQTYGDIDFKTLSRVFGDATRQSSVPPGVNSFVSPNPNIQFLVGVLPLVLRDTTLFPSNGSIADFAMSALGLDWERRWEKKSRFELIGEIVCSTIDLNDGELWKLVKALSILADGSSSAKKIVRDAHVSKRNWNDIIQLLVADKS
ncbi:hypothetical protein [Ramlibacter sp.]|uniref:hypothetical protein n=1 Tax=Ramlibacter sp. TaxID=1917967 RepID=UPI0017DC39C9|nr:hypothetical protein [Ramlibacter sp.]MBA2673010.1 hypothetical protein [Ramlibacter sp.]